MQAIQTHPSLFGWLSWHCMAFNQPKLHLEENGSQNEGSSLLAGGQGCVCVCVCVSVCVGAGNRPPFPYVPQPLCQPPSSPLLLYLWTHLIWPPLGGGGDADWRGDGMMSEQMTVSRPSGWDTSASGISGPGNEIHTGRWTNTCRDWMWHTHHMKHYHIRHAHSSRTHTHTQKHTHAHSLTHSLIQLYSCMHAYA